MQLFSDIDGILIEIKRVMKDSSTLAVMTYVKDGVWKEKEHQEYLEKLDIHFFEVEEIEKILKLNGRVILEMLILVTPKIGNLTTSPIQVARVTLGKRAV
jgi:hypothetical protein